MSPTGDHFYTTSAPKRDDAVNNLGYIDEGTACWLPTAGQSTAPLFRMYLALTGDHFYTTSAAEQLHATTILHYTDEGVAGDVLTSQAPGSVPLLRSFSPATGDHFYTTSQAEHQHATTILGYTDEGMACFVYDQSGAGRVPLFRTFRQHGAEVRLHFKIVQGFVAEGTACFVFLVAAGGRTPLFRSFNPATGDHFYTTSQAEHQHATTILRYNDEGAACFVPSAVGAGTVPLFRSHHPTASDHFYTTSQAEHVHATTILGYSDEGVVCQVFAIQLPETVPLFRLFDAEVVDHFYTTDAVESTDAQQHTGPNIPITTMTAAMRNTYSQAGIRVVVASTQFISRPSMVDVDVGGCPSWPIGTTGQQDKLYGNRDFVGTNDITVYFVRATLPPLAGCAAHPSGTPGAVVARGASLFTLAHEVGHVLGLSHVDSTRGCLLTRLMTGCGTGLITTNPPQLVQSEIVRMDSSWYTKDI